MTGPTVWTAGTDLVAAPPPGRSPHRPPATGTTFDALSANTASTTLMVATSNGDGNNPLSRVDAATGTVVATSPSYADAAANVVPRRAYRRHRLDHRRGRHSSVVERTVGNDRDRPRRRGRRPMRLLINRANRADRSGTGRSIGPPDAPGLRQNCVELVSCDELVRLNAIERAGTRHR